MSGPTKPTIIIFPGAFHPVSCLGPFIKALKDVGFPAEAHTLPSVGNPDIEAEDDVAFFRSVMMPHIEDGKDVLLVVHSYAGIPGAGAIAGLDKSGREARGAKGGVLGIAYLAAFVPREGESTYSMLGDTWLWWMKENDAAGLIDTHSHLEVFYKDCNPVEAAAVTATLKGHSRKALSTGIENIGYREAGYDGRRAYIRCLQDNALVLAAQDAFIENSGVAWVVKTLDSSHSPFLSMPAETAKTVAELATEFAAAT
ncbi:Uu.00g099220.m01.CDS01 [Anthostomella pinea]|uniref:Uu.00g099220.m01.CDS01 n=1 Tax=Anthostomella pinea TaxID=933095 RepID=A0AAI8VCU7_9PEZI|nr:Uu.00g099220.m01.CDS01 [Anthostomella pinea]